MYRIACGAGAVIGPEGPIGVIHAIILPSVKRVKVGCPGAKHPGMSRPPCIIWPTGIPELIERDMGANNVRHYQVRPTAA